MIWPAVESFAQAAVERVLNSLPEGILIALSAWLLLRLVGRQNSGTRFAVWMIAFVSVAALPLFGGFGAAHSSLVAAEFTLPASWAAAFLVFWIVVAIAALARVAAGVRQIRRIRGECREIPDAQLDPATLAILRQTRRPVRLLVSDKARVPAAIGFRRPAIVLPAWSLAEMSPSELQPILIHELAHLRRHDDWTNLLQKALRAILFFHPAVWWLDSRLSLEREMACDDAVLAATGNAHAYAGCLIGLLERSCTRRGWTMAQAAVARAREASQRIARILHSGGSATTRIACPALGMAAAISLAGGGVLSCMPHLLGFAPASGLSASAAQSMHVTADNLRLPAAAVVRAGYHPGPDARSMPAPGLVHNAMLTRKGAAQNHRLTLAAAHRSHPLAAPLVRASLQTPQRPAPSVPMILVVETTDITSAPAVPVAFSISAQQQNGELETLEFIAAAPGFRIQVVRVILAAPSKTAVPAGSDRRNI